MKSIEERVLEAAKNLFVQHGYKAATTKRIAENAGVNEVTLFRKYKTKDRLMETVIANTEANALASLEPIFDLDKDSFVQNALRAFGHNLIKFTRKEQDLMILQYAEGLRLPSVAESLSSVPQRILKNLTKYFEEQIRKGTVRKIDPKAAALILLSYISFSRMAELLFGEKFIDDHEKAFDDFLDVFTGGILESDGSG
ncbi:MAG: TetR/AcrR family transcriptional regulator [Candidatus Thorarchaeota archaeon]